MAAHSDESGGGSGSIDGTGAATRIALWLDVDTVTSSANATKNSNEQFHFGAGLVDGGISGESTFIVGRNTESTYSIHEVYNDQASRWAEFRAYNSNSGVQASLKANGGTMGGAFGGNADDNTVMLIHVGRMKVGSSGAYATEFYTNNTKRFEVSNDGRLLSSCRLQDAKGANIASASTLTFGFDGNSFGITGTTTVNHFTTTSWQAGSRVTLIAAAAFQLTHNAGAPPANTAPLLNSTGANITTVANRAYSYVWDGTNWIQD